MSKKLRKFIATVVVTCSIFLCCGVVAYASSGITPFVTPENDTKTTSGTYTTSFSSTLTWKHTSSFGVAPGASSDSILSNYATYSVSSGSTATHSYSKGAKYAKVTFTIKKGTLTATSSSQHNY